MSNLIERQHLDPEEGDALVIPKSFRHRDMSECALNIGDTDVADIIMGHLHGDPAENHATLAVENAFRSILDATAAIRERLKNCRSLSDLALQLCEKQRRERNASATDCMFCSLMTARCWEAPARHAGPRSTLLV
jgi:hypothetical protein